MKELLWADSDLHNSQSYGLTSVHWNQSWNVKTKALKYVITISGTPNIKVSWTLTLLCMFCFECTYSALLLLCYRLIEKEQLYRKVINQFENNNQSLVQENIRLCDTYRRLHTKLGCLTQQFTVLAVSPIIQFQCFIWWLVSVTSCQLSALHYYSMCGQFARYATLIHYIWAVCQVRYTNTLHVGSLPSVLHWYTTCGQFAKCATLIHMWAFCQLCYINTLHVGSLPRVLHWYTTCGQFAKCATLIRYMWVVCQVCYTNTQCAGSCPSALHQCGK